MKEYFNKLSKSAVLIMTTLAIMTVFCGCSRTNTKTCAECQTSIVPQSKYCFNCGTNIDETRLLKETRKE